MQRISKNQKRFLIIWVLIVAIGMIFGCINNSKYEHVKVGDGSMTIPKRIYDTCTEYNAGDYVVLESEDYLILGIGADCKKVDESVLEKFGFSNNIIGKINNIDSPYEIMYLLDEPVENYVDSGETNKPSFDDYYIKYKSDGREVSVFVYVSDNRGMAEIVVGPEVDLSRKETIDIIGGLQF
ncbi:hypothetical protein [Pseudobutyrivibrio ruminis]|uniref:Uncharacterized protein n=1 Tax=Pseudobutyrivibrio ruminis DSM 9787 TaxID=1123011 RepID=A0A285RWA2_9FIRM|nr:hypothetical protein [Pseudobutyrivibrio ruminis]SOB98763.1 hypothetical protein SAMN02910411_1534 [Pseudobutyrivibrio ruminis DSM 9787]